MNDFARDDLWQKGIRDAFLAPYLYGRYAHQGRYVFIDKGRMASQLQKRFAVDTISQRKDGEAICIEEKIVRWPTHRDGTPKRDGYSAFCLETHSCTNPGHESDGWMVYGEADFLLYCFTNFEETTLLCYRMDFQKLKQWFWPQHENFHVFQMKTANRTRGRVVPIADVCQALKEMNSPVKSWLLERESEAA